MAIFHSYVSLPEGIWNPHHSWGKMTILGEVFPHIPHHGFTFRGEMS